jgi:hypothetical protein
MLKTRASMSPSTSGSVSGVAALPTTLKSPSASAVSHRMAILCS